MAIPMGHKLPTAATTMRRGIGLCCNELLYAPRALRSLTPPLLFLSYAPTLSYLVGYNADTIPVERTLYVMDAIFVAGV